MGTILLYQFKESRIPAKSLVTLLKCASWHPHLHTLFRPLKTLRLVLYFCWPALKNTSFTLYPQIHPSLSTCFQMALHALIYCVDPATADPSHELAFNYTQLLNNGASRCVCLSGLMKEGVQALLCICNIHADFYPCFQFPLERARSNLASISHRFYFPSYDSS